MPAFVLVQFVRFRGECPWSDGRLVCGTLTIRWRGRRICLVLLFGVWNGVWWLGC